MILWHRFREILDPSCSIRLWTVNGSTWSNGEFRSFWRKKKAFELAEKWKNMMSWNFISVTRELTGERTKIKVDNRTPVVDEKTGCMLGFVEDEEWAHLRK